MNHHHADTIEWIPASNRRLDSITSEGLPIVSSRVICLEEDGEQIFLGSLIFFFIFFFSPELRSWISTEQGIEMRSESGDVYHPQIFKVTSSGHASGGVGGTEESDTPPRQTVFTKVHSLL